MLKYQYITLEGLENLKQHKYNGNNQSIFYKLFLKSIALKVLDITPEWLAPNLITLIGLFFPVVGFSLCFFLNPTMDQELPSLVPFLCGLFLFIYQTLDNLDGQQARKTGTSSPLGQLFDHGCDAVNVTISSATFANVIGLDYQWGCCLVLLSQFVFFVATWDEYHTHEMYLGPVNGADEGLVVTQFLMIMTSFFPKFWAFSMWNLHFNQWLVILQFIGMVLTFADFFIRVKNSATVAKTGLMPALLKFLPFLIQATCMGLYVSIPTTIPIASDFNAMLFFLCSGFVFAQYTGLLIIAYVCGMSWSPFQPVVFVMVALIIFQFLPKGDNDALVHQNFVLGLCTLIAAFAWAHYAVNCVRSIAISLGVAVFTIKKQLPV